MKIEGNGAIDAVHASAAVGAAQRTAVAQEPAKQSEPEDTTSLSSNSLAVSLLSAKALSSADERAAKVEALRQAVLSASYEVDPALVADAILSAGI